MHHIKLSGTKAYEQTSEKEKSVNNNHIFHNATTFAVSVNEDQERLSNDRNAFFTSDAVRSYNLWSCQKVCEALTFLLDNICIRFGSKLYRQIVGIRMGTNNDKDIGIINFVRRSQNFIGGILT